LKKESLEVGIMPKDVVDVEGRADDIPPFTSRTLGFVSNISEKNK
jgi:hypothetical protein